MNVTPPSSLWLDLASGAARGLQPHRDVAGEIADGFLDWVARRLQPEGDDKSSSSAPLFLAAIEGMYLLEAIGRGTIADAAVIGLATRSR